MKKWLAFLVAVSMLLSMSVFSVSAITPDGHTNEMYATDYRVGDEVAVSLPAANVDRLNPANALGMYDALQSSGTAANSKFYAVASYVYSTYEFEDDFVNVNGAPDISFCEVTWGNWHTEAALVYLNGAYVRDADGNAVPYDGNDDGYGYFAGIVWNKIGINGLSAAARDAVAEEHCPDGITRTFEANTFRQDGNFGWSEFYLPEEVVYASEVTLVDITAEVHSMAGTDTYRGNTDGYDLDAIRVFKYIPWKSGDTATGCSLEDGTGSKILSKGSWFMYNKVNLSGSSSAKFPIQAGNPKDGVNIIGYCTVTKGENNMYTVHYELDDTISANGYIYDIAVVDEHLGISDSMSFTAKPGQDDNQDFDVAFEDGDGEFCMFVHLAVEYR